MIKKKNIIRIIDIVFWGIILINVIIGFYNSINTGGINFHAENSDISGIADYLSIAFYILFLFLFLVITSLLKVFYLTILYIGIKIAYKKYYKEKLDVIDFKNDSYYRDTISKYSPAVLSYIDDFKLDEKDIVATLMSLELKKKIKIGDTIEVLDKNSKDLAENERFILEQIISNNLKNVDLLAFENCVINDCINDKLLERKTDIKKKIIKKISICVLAYILVSIAFYYLPTVFNEIQSDSWILLLFIIVILIMFFILIIFPLTTIIFIKSYYFMNKLNPYVRSKNAKNINSKLEGLKKYIKDYSLLDQKDYDNITLWENYLIYSVIFGLNTKIVDEIMKKL